MVMLDRKLYRIKNYPRAYKKKLKRINKTRERLNVVNHIQEVFNDLADFEFDYMIFEDPNWLEYLGQTWTLEDELDYCDRVNANMLKEYKLLNELEINCSKNFTEDEVNYYINSFKKAFDKEETDPIKRAMNALQAVRDYQEAWQKYGNESRLALYFGITNEKEAQE